MSCCLPEIGLILLTVDAAVSVIPCYIFLETFKTEVVAGDRETVLIDLSV